MDEQDHSGTGSPSIALQKRMLRQYARSLRQSGEMTDDDVEAFLGQIDGLVGKDIRSVLSALASHGGNVEHVLREAEEAYRVLLDCLPDRQES